MYNQGTRTTNHLENIYPLYPLLMHHNHNKQKLQMIVTHRQLTIITLFVLVPTFIWLSTTKVMTRPPIYNKDVEVQVLYQLDGFSDTKVHNANASADLSSHPLAIRKPQNYAATMLVVSMIVDVSLLLLPLEPSPIFESLRSIQASLPFPWNICQSVLRSC